MVKSATLTIAIACHSTGDPQVAGVQRTDLAHLGGAPLGHLRPRGLVDVPGE
jgi:hypothetical protein